VLAAVVLLLGKTQSVLSRKATLHAEFASVSGLIVGAPVRLAGVDVGIVEAIRFDKDLKEKKVHVTLGVESRYLERIREDSIAHLTSKGLLGDMLINITVGSADRRALVSGDTIAAQETVGLTDVVDSVQEGISEIRKLTGKVDDRINAVLTDEVARDLGRIMHHGANLVEHVEKGGGTVHELIYDPKLARDVAGVVVEARRIAAGLDRAVARVDRIVAAVESGDGTLHAVIYGAEGKRLLAEAARAVAELEDVVSQLQRGHGLIHSLVYETDRSNLVENLTAMSKILRDVAEDVSRGRGTLGGLLRDPSVYEDLKIILGNVKRNRILRTLVRYTIEKDRLSAPAK
jgi:phospholipid/cholesterol/gamma-HCH transport system substrate-binding protein